MRTEWSGRAPKTISRFLLIEPRHSCPDVQSAASWRQGCDLLPTRARGRDMGTDVYSTEVNMCFDAASGINERSALMQTEWSGRAPKTISRFMLIEPRHSCPAVPSAASWRQSCDVLPTRARGRDMGADVYSTGVNMCFDAASDSNEHSARMQTEWLRRAPKTISRFMLIEP